MKKRYYEVDERVWIIGEQTEGIVKDIDIPNKEMTVEYRDNNGSWSETTRNFWDFDKYRASKTDDNVTYFASVLGGVVPKRESENAGRDCFARIDKNSDDYSNEYDGIYIPKGKVTKVPLGFASYLNKEDLLYIGMERSSVGSLGILVLSGLIDSTYQGEVIVQLTPLFKDVVITDKVDKVVEYTDLIQFPLSKAIAQATVIAQSQREDKVIPYDELLKKPSTRGVNGWGSTDKK